MKNANKQQLLQIVLHEDCSLEEKYAACRELQARRLVVRRVKPKEKKTPKRMLISVVTELIDRHPGTYEKCTGCWMCELIQEISQQWEDDVSKKERVQTLLAKGKDMTKSEIIHLIDIGVTRRQIQKAAKMEPGMFSEILRAWGLNRNKGA